MAQFFLNAVVWYLKENQIYVYLYTVTFFPFH